MSPTCLTALCRKTFNSSLSIKTFQWQISQAQPYHAMTGSQHTSKRVICGAKKVSATGATEYTRQLQWGCPGGQWWTMRNLGHLPRPSVFVHGLAGRLFAIFGWCQQRHLSPALELVVLSRNQTLQRRHDIAKHPGRQTMPQWPDLKPL